MEIHCPFCGHSIIVKGGKPGGYRPQCPRCAQAYVLVIPPQPGQPLLVGKTLEEVRVKAAPAVAPPGSTGVAATKPSQALAAIILDDGPTESRATTASAAATAPPVAPPPPPSRLDATATTPLPPRRDLQATAPAPAPVRTPAPVSPHPAAVEAALPPDTPDRLGGYEIVRILGRGGMGAVYLARQLSLDRLVAVKTIHSQWAGDPMFVSRFTREAFAAAQLVHHNVVQIHDIGEDAGTHFFSMEYVAGKSLADMLREHGRLDPEAAAGYILQAARGLKYAHDHGMVHRDVKPHNLLLSDEDGVVKVADLGLVKRQDRQELTRAEREAHGRPADVASTSADASMGSPAYMAPEQARDATAVDARADIYALGVTFYQLVTGQLPYHAETAAEMAKLHAQGNAAPPDEVNPRVPKPLSQVILRMMAADPAKRYPHLGEVIAALERFLNITAGPFTPQEEHARVLEAAVDAFNRSKPARLRRLAVLGFFAACAIVAVLGLVIDRAQLFGGAVALGLFTLVSYGVVTGFVRRPLLFKKIRQFVFGSSFTDWLVWAVVFLLVVGAIVATGQTWLYVGVLVVAVLLAVAFALGADRAVAKDRAPYVHAVQEMLKGMRLRGLEEDALRRFVCRYSGDRWEPFYEAMFGYEAKLFAREHWGRGDDGRPRKRYGTWRDGVVRWIDQRQRTREETRQRRHLQKIEERRLRAEGKTEAEAKKRAARVADDLVENIAEIRTDGGSRAVVVARVLGKPLPRTKDDLGDEEVPESWRIQRASAKATLWGLVFGNKGRLIAGAVLLLIPAWWMRRYQMLPQFEGRGSIWRTIREFARQDAPPIDVPGLPRVIEDVLCSQSAAVAGALLIVSALFRGTRQTWLLLPAVAVLLLGPRLIPSVGVISPQLTSIAAGLVLGVAALWLGRKS